MWPFKPKKKEPEINLTQEAINDLKAFRDIGEKFNYMGIEMIVESHWQPDIYSSGYARISAAYKSNDGKLKHANFTRRELPALRAENP